MFDYEYVFGKSMLFSDDVTEDAFDARLSIFSQRGNRHINTHPIVCYIREGPSSERETDAILCSTLAQLSFGVARNVVRNPLRRKDGYRFLG